MLTFLPLVMDVMVMALLGATVFYAVRLSKQLRVFRQTKGDLQHLIGDLSGQITQAEMAITGLREAARESGRDLQELISEGNALKDELGMMHDSANRLASRLEDAATRKSTAQDVARRQPQSRPARKDASVTQSFEIKDPDEWDVDIEEEIEEKAMPSRSSRPASLSDDKPSPFMIRDPEFDTDDAGDDDWSGGTIEDELEDFQSRAEKELFEALHGKKKLETAGDA